MGMSRRSFLRKAAAVLALPRALVAPGGAHMGQGAERKRWWCIRRRRLNQATLRAPAKWGG